MGLILRGRKCHPFANKVNVTVSFEKYKKATRHDYYQYEFLKKG